MKPKDQEDHKNNEKTTADPELYQTAEEAYAMLVEYVKDELTSSPGVINFCTLTDKLKELIVFKRLEQIKDSTKKHIRQKLEKRFGDELLPGHRGKMLDLQLTLDRQ